MQIIRNGSVPSVKGPAEWFTGDVRIDMMFKHEGGSPVTGAIITFEPEGSGTRYTARVLHWSEEAMKQHEEMGFHEGWGAVAGQLADLAEGRSTASAA